MVLKRRVPWYASSFVMFAVAFGVSAARWPRPVLACKIASAWVAEHVRELPSSLADLSKYQLGYRKAIYANLPPETQRQLWHEQFTAFLTPPDERTGVQRRVAGRATLSDQQQRFLRNERERLEVAFDTSVRVEQRQAAAHVASLRARAYFSDALARDVFYVLGPRVGTPPPLPRAGSVAHANVLGWFDAAVITIANRFGRTAGELGCDCNYNQYPNPDCSGCCVYIVGCDPSTGGCGYTGADPCTGQCFQCRQP